MTFYSLPLPPLPPSSQGLSCRRVCPRAVFQDCCVINSVRPLLRGSKLLSGPEREAETRRARRPVWPPANFPCKVQLQSWKRPGRLAKDWRLCQRRIKGLPTPAPVTPWGDAAHLGSTQSEGECVGGGCVLGLAPEGRATGQEGILGNKASQDSMPGWMLQAGRLMSQCPKHSLFFQRKKRRKGGEEWKWGKKKKKERKHKSSRSVWYGGFCSQYGWSELRCAVSKKYTPDFTDLAWKRNINK